MARARKTRLILASASPRRAEILRDAGFEFEVRTANVDEIVRRGEAPAAHVERLAQEKAGAVAQRVVGPAVVIGADTVVVVKGRILGKPRSAKRRSKPTSRAASPRIRPEPTPCKAAAGASSRASKAATSTW